MSRLAVLAIFLVGFSVTYFAVTQLDYWLIKPTEQNVADTQPSLLEDKALSGNTEEIISPSKPEEIKSNNNTKVVSETDKKEIKHDTNISATIPDKILHNVPFTVQAPFARWSDPRLQDGCEEASMLMAKYWLAGKQLDQSTAYEEIIALSAWEKEKYGTFQDTSAKDTSNTLQEYFGINNELVENLTVEEIKQFLANGSIVLIPSDGSILNNPNYSSAPIYHMIAVIGYDEKKSQFIVNDPGTKNGEKYRYSYNTIMESARDYPTGNHIEAPYRYPRFIVIPPQ